MAERTGRGGRSSKAPGQDALGLLFCGLGGLFAVSLVLDLMGWEPRGGAWTWPVVELRELLGPWAALALCAGLAGLGSVLFLRRSALPPGRPLIALLGVALGLSFLLGIPGRGGLLGSIFPGLLGGLGGGLLAGGLGVATLLVGLALWLGEGGRGAKPGSIQQIVLPVEAASGVSAAEAALLVPEVSRATKAQARQGRGDKEAARPVTAPNDPRSIRDETIRPHAPPGAAEAARGRRVTVATTPLAPRERIDPDLASTARRSAELASGQPRGERPSGEAQAVATSSLPPAGAAPVPSWEPPAGLAVPQVAEAEEPEERTVVPGRTGEEGVQGPTASWEQIGLFDEEESEEDLDPGAPEGAVASSRSPRDSGGDAAPGSARQAPATEEDLRAPAVADAEEAELEILPASRTETGRAERSGEAGGSAPAGGEGEGWRTLVFDAGCLILEQNRVAVSMLERRFAIDFDQACRVLDELQQAGLIGPYMGGRTRDILLTREEWLAHAPNAF